MKLTEQIACPRDYGVKTIELFCVYSKQSIAMLFLSFVIAIAYVSWVYLGGWTAGVFGGFVPVQDFVERSTLGLLFPLFTYFLC